MHRQAANGARPHLKKWQGEDDPRESCTCRLQSLVRLLGCTALSRQFRNTELKTGFCGLLRGLALRAN